MAIASTSRVAATGRVNRPRKRIAVPVGSVKSAAAKLDPVAARGHALYGYFITDRGFEAADPWRTPGGPLADL